MDAGRTVYTCMLNKQAGLEADLTVSIIRDEMEQGVVNPFKGVGVLIKHSQ